MKISELEIGQEGYVRRDLCEYQKCKITWIGCNEPDRWGDEDYWVYVDEIKNRKFFSFLNEKELKERLEEDLKIVNAILLDAKEEIIENENKLKMAQRILDEIK